ncbi:MAG: DUF1868 domain-containing protein [Cyanosarcina radialis HA8281-LM2]|nr:DUF1868 domain-containing protein [Cyanosarcina radialis HA8281-LM2]
MDESYQTYLNRAAKLTLPATYESQVHHLQESPKFAPAPDGSRQAVSFPGYSVITPSWEEESENSEFYANLKALQADLVERLDDNLLVPIPPESFHLTLADLIWDSAYRELAASKPDFEEQLREAIAQSFGQCQQAVEGHAPSGWQIFGLMVMPRALAVCLLPQNRDAYEQILQLRRFIYQNPRLIALGIEQQYHFTPHVTLGYFGEIRPQLDRMSLASILSQLNQQWLERPQQLWVKQAQLRKFDDMTRYYRQPDWPVLEF